MHPRSTQLARRSRPAALSALLLGLLLLLAGGCATPVGVERADPQAVHRELTGNVLSTGELSDFSANVLRRAALDELAGRDPEAALAELHATGAGEAWARPEVLFALAELSFRHAEDTGQPAYHLAAAVYAFAYLFPEGAGEEAPSPFDPRFRWAADLYNRGLTRAFESADGRAFEPRGGGFALPFGTLDVAFDPAELLLWDDRRLTGFVPVADLQVRGLHNRYRWPGLGAPLAAGTKPLRAEQGFQVGPQVKVPVTALLLLDQPRHQLAAGRLRGSLRLFAAADEEAVPIAGRTVPLEVEPTAALAYTASNPALWQTELRGFLRGDLLRGRPSNLVAMQPHRPGRFPVVLVHGTASSAGRWADLVNDLTSEPEIRDRFEFWFFSYETGNPIPYSALQLRDALTAAVERLDPAGQDPALREMVVVGHSQGGLLTKMTAIDTTEGQFWDRFSSKPPEELRLRPETRDLLRRALFVEPLPFVGRLVFVATPHGGSYLTEWSVTGVIARLVRLPLTLTRATAELVTLNADALRFNPGQGRFGSLFGMTPGSPLITALADAPVAPGVAAHSIVAVQGNGPVAEGGDGVVRYASAHIDGVESELVVRSGHSVQGNPHTVEEVRRILLLHAATACAGRGIGCPDEDPLLVSGATIDGTAKPREPAVAGGG